jgi:hypothetical protein
MNFRNGIGYFHKHFDLNKIKFIDYDQLLEFKSFPKYNYFQDNHSKKIRIFVSHRWLTKDNPDPDNSQFNELISVFNTKYKFFYDYSCLPQKSVKRKDKKYFKSVLKNINLLITYCYVYCIYDISFMKRTWCYSELFLACLCNNLINYNDLSIKLYEFWGDFEDGILWSNPNKEETKDGEAVRKFQEAYKKSFNYVILAFRVLFYKTEVTNKKDKRIIWNGIWNQIFIPKRFIDHMLSDTIMNLNSYSNLLSDEKETCLKELANFSLTEEDLISFLNESQGKFIIKFKKQPFFRIPQRCWYELTNYENKFQHTDIFLQQICFDIGLVSHNVVTNSLSIFPSVPSIDVSRRLELLTNYDSHIIYSSKCLLLTIKKRGRQEFEIKQKFAKHCYENCLVLDQHDNIVRQIYQSF